MATINFCDWCGRSIDADKAQLIRVYKVDAPSEQDFHMWVCPQHTTTMKLQKEAVLARIAKTVFAVPTDEAG